MSSIHNVCRLVRQYDPMKFRNGIKSGRYEILQVWHEKKTYNDSHRTCREVRNIGWGIHRLRVRIFVSVAVIPTQPVSCSYKWEFGSLQAIQLAKKTFS